MRKIVKILPVVLLLFSGTGKGQEVVFIASSAFDQSTTAYHLPASNSNQGFLETTKMSIGTIFKSHHFSNDDFNETHNGIYLSIERWSLGTFENSGNVQSTFVTYNPNLYRSKQLKVNLVAGVADGYEGWEYAQGDYLPIMGVSAQWMYLKAILNPELMAFGIELPLN